MADQDASQISFATSDNIDQAIIEQVRGIEEQIAGAFPLISEKEDITALSKNYADDDTIYQAKLKDLYSRYTHMRFTRGDGNCFFRAFGFCSLEACLSDLQLLEKLVQKAEMTKASLIKLGYPSYTVEDFHETFVEILDVAKKGQNLDDIMQIYNDQSYSDYLVVFLRLMVSCYLQQNEEFYCAFIENYASMKDFCSHEVEPMAKECDHIHIIALTNVLNTTVQVEYMDRGGKEDSCNHHRFPDDGSKPIMHLLYRPGHYDILYSKADQSEAT